MTEGITSDNYYLSRLKLSLDGSTVHCTDLTEAVVTNSRDDYELIESHPIQAHTKHLVGGRAQ